MAAGAEDTTTPTGYSLPPGVTVEEVKAAVKAYVASKGKNPSTEYIIQTIIPKIQKTKQDEVSAKTDEQKRKDKEILTPEGLDSFYQSIVPTTPAPIVTGEPAPPTRSVSSSQANLDAAAIEKGSLRTLHGGVKGAIYSGQLLVDENGNITQFPSTDNTGGNQSVFLFQKLKQTGQLSLFLSKLEDKGFYQGQKPSQLALSGNNLGDTDARAFDSYITAANIAKLTPMAFVPKMMSLPSAASTGSGGPKISSVEAARYLRQESFSALGRPLTESEMKAAVSYVKSQVASSVNPDVAAQEKVLTSAPEEAATYSLGLALNRMFGA